MWHFCGDTLMPIAIGWNLADKRWEIRLYYSVAIYGRYREISWIANMCGMGRVTHVHYQVKNLAERALCLASSSPVNLSFPPCI